MYKTAVFFVAKLNSTAEYVSENISSLRISEADTWFWQDVCMFAAIELSFHFSSASKESQPDTI